MFGWAWHRCPVAAAPAARVLGGQALFGVDFGLDFGMMNAPLLVHIWVWLKITGGVTQVLVHVSTYQASILVFRFFEPQPYRCPKGTLMSIARNRAVPF